MRTWDGCWVGVVRSGREVIYRSRPVTTWDEAKRRAERRAKRGGKRPGLDVCVMDSLFAKDDKS